MILQIFHFNLAVMYYFTFQAITFLILWIFQFGDFFLDCPLFFLQFQVLFSQIGELCSQTWHQIAQPQKCLVGICGVFCHKYTAAWTSLCIWPMAEELVHTQQTISMLLLTYNDGDFLKRVIRTCTNVTGQLKMINQFFLSVLVWKFDFSFILFWFRKCSYEHRKQMQSSISIIINPLAQIIVLSK